MGMLVVLTIVLLAGVYSVVRPETRDYDDRDRRGWWPGHK
jgi:cbb3-type cytochrome oxidase subunit 3